mmetsp:Transcript_922/g.1952  ORF Transcript_922/g.1952 Transcript_922/m.1952 type:complete len:625 (-) Transcript_922:170-2044(-)
MSHVRTIQTVVAQVGVPFCPKHDPSRSLAEEIESCKRKIWECIDLTERNNYFEKKQKKDEKLEYNIESKSENSKNSSDKNTRNIGEPVVVAEMAQKNNNQPPLTRTDIELKVFVLKVVELKKELKARGQDTSGLKKDLRNRLINTMLDDIQGEQLQYASALNKLHLTSIIVEESFEEQKESPDNKVVSKDLREKDKLEEKRVARSLPTENEKFGQGQRNISTTSMQVEHHCEVTEQAQKLPKQIFEDLVPSDQKQKQEQEQEKSRQTSMHKRPLKTQEGSLAAIREMHVVTSNISDSCNKSNPQSDEEKSELTEIKVNKLSQVKKEGANSEDVTRPSSEVSCSSKTSGNSVKDMVSKFSGFSSSHSSSNNGSALSKGLQAKKEARQAKIAEMRAKAQSKPGTSTKVALTSKEFTSTLSSLNATTSIASAQKKNLATQMREKAAARAFQNKITNSVSKIGSKPLSTSNNHRHLPFTNTSINTVSDSLGATLKQPPLIKKPLKILSPLDTYEISDREDSETDDSDSESDNDKPKKKIPTWAQRANLYSALEEQYNGQIGSMKVDPDDIFHEVKSCDLEAIFGPKKSKLYKKRASSGNWVNDQVTVAEKLIYKREMGFAIDADGPEV